MDRLELLARYRCPRYEDFPAIALYKDQVIFFLTQAVAPLCEEDQTPVTASMINNYVKLRVISAPARKKYSREQVICLYVTLLLKQVLSMDEIRALLQLEFRPEQAEQSYRRFVQLLEDTLSRLLSGQPLPVSAQPSLLEAVIRSFLYRRCAAALLQERTAPETETKRAESETQQPL